MSSKQTLSPTLPLTAKEMAFRLVNRIYQPLGLLGCNKSSEDMWEWAKARAMEVVNDGILNAPLGAAEVYVNDVTYWLDVKERIKKLGNGATFSLKPTMNSEIKKRFISPAEAVNLLDDGDRLHIYMDHELPHTDLIGMSPSREYIIERLYANPDKIEIGNTTARKLGHGIAIKEPNRWLFISTNEQKLNDFDPEGYQPLKR